MISNLTQESWDAKVIEFGGSILQSWGWGEFQKSLGQKIYRFSPPAGGDDFVNLAVETELPLGKKYLYCPRGPLGNVEAALLDLKKMQSDRSLIFARLEPAQKVDLPTAVKNIQPENNWLLDLEPTEEQILIGMKPKTRYNINLASRKGVIVREGTQSDLLIVWQLLLETANRNKIRLHSQNYYFQMWEHLNRKHLKILIAEYHGQPLAGMILTLFGSTATYLHGGSGPKMKEAMASYLLHWEAIKIAKSLGLKYYDFGGVAPSFDSPSRRGGPQHEENHSWTGITRFKKSFGGFVVQYPGAYDLIYSPIWYNVYKQARLARKLIG